MLLMASSFAFLEAGSLGQDRSRLHGASFEGWMDRLGEGAMQKTQTPNPEQHAVDLRKVSEFQYT